MPSASAASVSVISPTFMWTAPPAVCAPIFTAISTTRNSIPAGDARWLSARSEEHTSELQSLMRISYAVFCLKKKNKKTHPTHYKKNKQSQDSKDYACKTNHTKHTSYQQWYNT